MLEIAFAAALTTQAAVFDLRLTCPGEYHDTETATAQSQRRDPDGNWRTVTTHMQTPIVRSGAAQISLSGDAGELVYPDGRKRPIKIIAADAGHIHAEYERKALLGRTTWRIEINRMTGDVRVASGNEIAFQGQCSPEPTTPKF